MFIIPSKKIAIIFNPRTGSMSHHALLWQYKDLLYIPEEGPFAGQDLSNYTEFHWHTPMYTMAMLYPKHDLKEYRFLAFYRDPVDRFLSGVPYWIWREPHKKFAANMSPRAYVERGGFRLQTIFLSYPEYAKEAELFNFHEFIPETIRMFAEIGVTIKPTDIPNVNETPRESKRTRDSLTQKELNQIHKYWAEDYEWFEARGIKFD